MKPKDVSNKIPIYKLQSAEEVLQYYQNWTNNNKYNADMIEWNYTAPKESVKLLKKYTSNNQIKILDAGCGSGLVGIELKKNSYQNIYGLDFSQDMINLIPKNIYKDVVVSDLNKPINYKNNIFDAILCVGTFTFGHVRPHALDELIRISKKNSLICFTINEGIYEEYEFDKKIKHLSQKKHWEVIEFYKTSYIKNKDVSAWLCITKVK